MGAQHEGEALGERGAYAPLGASFWSASARALRPDAFLPPRPPGCPLCNDVGFRGEPDQAAGGQLRYAPCACLTQRECGQRLARLRALADFGPQLHGVRLEALQPNGVQYAAYRAVSALIAQPTCIVVLLGSVGAGKTRFAAAAAEALAEHMEVAFYKAPGLLGTLKAAFGSDLVPFEERLDQLAQVAFLVLDDLGTEIGSSWAQSTLHRVVDSRYDHGRPLLITTNVPLAHMGERLASRLLDRTRCRLAVIDGPDWRESGPGAAGGAWTWRPGPAPDGERPYLFGTRGYAICPRCSSRPCLDNCAQPMFAAPKENER